MSISVKQFVLNSSNLISTEPIGSDCFYVPGIVFIQYIRQNTRYIFLIKTTTAELRN